MSWPQREVMIQRHRPGAKQKFNPSQLRRPELEIRVPGLTPRCGQGWALSRALLSPSRPPPGRLFLGRGCMAPALHPGLDGGAGGVPACAPAAAGQSPKDPVLEAPRHPHSAPPGEAAPESRAGVPWARVPAARPLVCWANMAHPKTSLGLGFLISKTGRGTEPWGRPGTHGTPTWVRNESPKQHGPGPSLGPRTETLLTLHGHVAVRETLRPHRAHSPPRTHPPSPSRRCQARHPPQLVPEASGSGANAELPH